MKPDEATVERSNSGPIIVVDQDELGNWRVKDDTGTVLALCRSNAEAWQMVDRLDRDAQEMEETHRRIGRHIT